MPDTTLKCGHPAGCWREGSKTCGWCVAENKANIATAEVACANVRIAELDDELFRKTARCLELAEANAELDALFDARWSADMRAVKIWRGAHPDSDIGIPDRTDLVVWLLETRVPQQQPHAAVKRPQDE